jgi:hypothetical protein
MRGRVIRPDQHAFRIESIDVVLDAPTERPALLPGDSFQRKATVTTVVCAGPSCRGPGRTKLCTVLLEAGLEVEASGCLGICEGPVAAAPIGDRWEIIRKVDDKRRRAKLVSAVTSGQRSKVRGRLVAGSRRKKALRRAMKSL